MPITKEQGEIIDKIINKSESEASKIVHSAGFLFHIGARNGIFHPFFKDDDFVTISVELVDGIVTNIISVE